MPDTTRQILRPGDGITRWAMADPVAQHFPGTARPMPDRVDYRFVNGWVDTGDLPCREALLTIRGDNDNRPPDLPQADFHSIHLCDSPDADFSQFCHRPTLIRHLLRCTLVGTGTARFRLSTCGGVRLWLGDRLHATFQPYSRNRKQSCDIALPMSPEGTPLTVELEDLHERDTTCFVSLALIDGAQVSAVLPDAPSDIVPVMEAMASLRTDRIFYREGPVSLICDAPPATPLALGIEGIGAFPRGDIDGREGHLPAVAATLSAAMPGVPLFDSTLAPQGCIGLTVRARIGTGTIQRVLGCTVLTRATSLNQPTLAGRKAAARAAMASTAPNDAASVLAHLAQGQTEGLGTLLERSLTHIERRHDCCDFTILPMLRILRDHGSLLPGATALRLRDAILTFRYWLDEPGDDVMWFWSENHVACFHIAQLVAGGMFPDAIFANSGRSGADLRAGAITRLHRWFDAIETHGLGEWNSAAYYPIDLLALLSLHDMGGDPALSGRAAALMDTIFIMTGLHTSGGVPAGSQGRSYEKELLAGPATELGSVAAIAFGGDFIPGFNRAAALFCLSDYAPPDTARTFARPAPDETVTARYTQGLDHLGKLTLHKTAHSQISTVCDHKSGQPGHQQHVIDVQCAAHPMARMWINHPGELKEWGDRRPSLLAGNGYLPWVAQHGAMATLIYDLPDEAIGFTQMFAAIDAFDGIETSQGWILLFSGDACIAVWCSAPLDCVTRGQYTGSLWRAHARCAGWVVIAGDATLPETLSTPTFDGTTLTARHQGMLALTRSGPPRINGAPKPFAPLSPIPHIARDARPLTPWTTA